VNPRPTNLSIAQAVTPRRIEAVAGAAGFGEEDFEPLGRTRGKLTWAGVERLTAEGKRGKLILVSAVTPTPAGEGKTTVSVGLAQGLSRIGRSAVPALREPALGPVFGLKGGACGGGYSQLLPMEEINLHFNGDFHAITAAHNLLAAALDAHLHHGNAAGIDARTVLWPRTVDMNDRALRNVVVGLGGHANGVPREDGFVITPASEVMAVLCLASDLADLKARLGRMIVALGLDGRPVRAAALGVTGAMTVLLRDALRPNLVQTLEGGPALVHGGPFGNIAHGCSSILATRCGLGMADFLVTEGGFGSDLGGQKFLDIVCPLLGRGPDAIVLVATIRALEHHGAGDLELGLANLDAHIDHLSQYGPPVIVAINRFADDDEDAHQSVIRHCASRSIPCVSADPWNGGGAGCEALAEAVVELSERGAAFRPLMHPGQDFESRLDTIVRQVYGGAGFTLEPAAERRLAWAREHALADLPVCVAKSAASLSDDAGRAGRPEGFTLRVKEIRPAAGAGFLVAVAGDILLMPGLGKSPAAHRIDVDGEGNVSGLY